VRREQGAERVLPPDQLRELHALRLCQRIQGRGPHVAALAAARVEGALVELGGAEAVPQLRHSAVGLAVEVEDVAAAEQALRGGAGAKGGEGG
jgi:hypothetical protein